MTQRLFDDREVNLYPGRRGSQRRDPDLDFPNRAKELRIATATIAGPKASGKADVYLVLGQVFQIAFKLSPEQLGNLVAIEVRDVRVLADPMIPAPETGVAQLVIDLDPVVRTDLEAMWADESANRVGLASSGEIYRIQLGDADYVVLAQLQDTSFLVAAIDPPRPGVRRVWPDGELVGEYPDVRSAVVDR